MTVIEIESAVEEHTRHGVTIVSRKGTYSLCGSCVVGGHHLAAHTLFPGMDGPCERCGAARTSVPAADEVLVACGHCMHEPAGSRCIYCGGGGRQIVTRCRRCHGETGEQPTNKPGVGVCRCPPVGAPDHPTRRRPR